MPIDGYRMAEVLLVAVSNILNIMIHVPSSEDIEIPLWLVASAFGTILLGIRLVFKWMMNRKY